MRVRLLFGIMLSMLVAGRASAQGCDAILSRELLTNTTTRSATLAREAQRADYCRREGKTNRSSTDVSAGGSYGVISGDASYGQAQSEEFKKEDCGSSDASSQSDAFRYYAQRALGEQVVTAWSDCMRRQDNLVCYAQPPIQGANPVMHVVWRPTSRRAAFVTSSRITNGRNVDTPESPTTVFARGSALRLNDELVEVSRVTGSAPTQVRVNVDQDGTAYGCYVTIPRLVVPRAPAPARGDLYGRFRAMRFADLPQCQERRRQMLYLIEGSSAAPMAFPEFPRTAAAAPPAGVSQAVIAREQAARDAANRGGTIIQFDQLDRMSRSDGCLR